MTKYPSKLTYKEKRFFHQLEEYLDTKLYFYGSIIRNDYIPGKSDIDVSIFTGNETSMKMKLLHYLHAPKSAFEKIVWKYEDTILYGYKIKCNQYVGVNCEIVIYNKVYKDLLLKELYLPITNSFYLSSFLLKILKFFYYQLPILPSKLYSRIKRFILNDLMGKKETVFITLP